MPSLAQLYETIDKKDHTLVVSVGGFRLRSVISASWSFAVSKVPTATIRIPHPIPSNVAFFADIRVDAGFDGVTQRVFTGKVWRVNPDETGVQIECVGKSWPLDAIYHSVVVTLTSITVQTAITNLLNSAAIDDFEVNMPAWTIGTATAQTLVFATFGDAINKIAEVDGGRWYELPTGVVRVEPLNPVPSLTVFRNYFSMVLTGETEAFPPGITSGRPRLRRTPQQQRPRLVKNQVFVRGAVVTTTVGGLDSSTTIEADASAPSPWVLLPDGSQAFNDLIFANELIDTLVKAAEVAGRLVALHNRLIVEVNALVDGDPQLALAQTVRIEDPDYSRTTGRWFVEGYQTVATPNDFTTTMRVLGGVDAGGTINISPFALFTHKADLEVIGDRQWVVLTLDARAAFDPDGSIASYSWTDNQGPPVVSGTRSVVFVRADATALALPWLVTLTVTDNDGATDDVTIEILVPEGSADVFVPALYCAFDNNFSATPDGGVTWNDQLGTDVISVAAPPGVDRIGIACFGTSAGQIFRTTDFCQTAPTLVYTSPGGSPIVDLEWDPLFAFAWAVTQDGKVLQSLDDGVNWEVFDDLRLFFGQSLLTLTRIYHVVGVVGLWVFGNRGDGTPFISVGIALFHNWIQPTIGGDFATDLIAAGFPSGTVDVTVQDAALAIEQGPIAIILNSAAFTPTVYYADNAYTALTDGSIDWQRATGLPANTRGRWIVEDLESERFALGYDDQAIYLGDVAGSPGVMAVVAAAATLNPTDHAHHAIRVQDLAGAFLLAVEGAVDGTIMKTWNRFASIDELRPAVGFPAVPAGANAQMLAQAEGGGPEGQVLLDELLVAMGIDVSPREVSTLIGVGATWTAPMAMPAGITNGHPRIYPLTSLLWFVTNSDNGENAFGWGTGARSTDGGATWAATPAPPGFTTGGIMHFARDAGGRIWCIVHDTHAVTTRTAIFFSDDDGATWALSTTHGSGGGVERSIAWKIVPHPSDENVIAIIGFSANVFGGGNTDGYILFTQNRGTSWSSPANNDAAISLGQVGMELYDCIMTPNGRLVAQGPFNVVAPVRWDTVRSDDFGATAWTLAERLTSNTITIAGLFHSVGQDRLAYMTSDTAVATDQRNKLRISNDGGATWGVVNLVQELAAFVGLGSLFEIRRLTMSPARDAIYISTEQAINIVKLTPVTAAGVWTDLTDAYPHAAEGRDNLAVIAALPVPTP